MTEWRRGSLAAVVVFMIAVTSASCIAWENVGPIEISRSDDQLAVAFCTEQRIETLRVLQLAPGATARSDWQLAWEGVGPVDVQAGDVIYLGAEPGLFSSVVQLEDFRFLEQHSYEIDVDTERGGYQVTFRVPSGGLDDDTWIAPTGRIGQTACEAFNIGP